MHPTAWWQPFLPFVAIAVVLALRLRNINRTRRMHLGRLLVAPIIVGLLAIYLFMSVPPDGAGLAIFAVGLAVGAAIGWQRARLMKVSYDPASNTFSLKQSPLAVVLLIAIMLLRRLALPGVAMSGGATNIPRALGLINGLIGFGLGTVMAHNLELWLRARAMRAKALSDTFK